MAYEYGGFPPVPVTVIIPSLQPILWVTTAVTPRLFWSKIVTVPVKVQPSSEVTVTVYVPGFKLLNV